MKVSASESETRFDDSRQPAVKFANRTRFAILTLVTLCLSIVLSNALTLNFTVICMADPMPNIDRYNSTGTIMRSENGSLYELTSSTDSSLSLYRKAVSSRRYAYTPSQKSTLFSAVAIGAMISVLPSMFLIQKFGARVVMLYFGLFSAAVTSLVPLMAYYGLIWLIVFRVLQGLPLGMGFCMIGNVTTNWSMHKQSAFFIAVLTAFFQFGPIFTMPVAGALCTSSFGWASVYYVHALVTVLLYSLLYTFYREFPDDHFCVSDKELDRIRREKGGSGKREPVPIREILSTHAVYAVWLSGLGNFMGIQVTMQFSPIYLNKVLGFPVGMTGLFSCVPQIVTFVVKLIAAVISDKATCHSPLVSTKIFNTIALGGMGVAFVALAYVPPSEPIVGILVLIVCTCIIGFNCGAFFKASQLMARQHNHFLMGVQSFLNCLSTFLAPVIVKIFVTNDTAEEWWYVWMVYGVSLFLLNIHFLFFGKTDAAPWTQKGQKTGNSVISIQIGQPPYKVEYRDKMRV